MKLPSLQFYPGDWMKDPSVRAISLAARGLLIHILCISHGTPEQLARQVGVSPAVVKKLLAELEDAGLLPRVAAFEKQKEGASV